MNHFANHRPSLPSVNLSATRRSQLAFLAEQASLASVGTSSLRVARAQSVVMDEAVKSAMGSSSAAASQVKQEAGTVSPTSAARDKAWEETLSSSDFLSSASSLAQMFHVQEQSRKDWAGQALALQQRRWTVSSGRPSMVLASKNKGKRRAIEGSDSAAAETDDRRVSTTPPSPSKKRRLTFADVGPGKGKDRRVSFAVQEDDEERSIDSLSSRGQPPGPPNSLANVLASFETLLDFRSKACAGLAELAKRADEMDTFRSQLAVASPAAAAIGSAPATAVTSATATATTAGSDDSSPGSSVFVPSSEEGSPGSSDAAAKALSTASADMEESPSTAEAAAATS